MIPEVSIVMPTYNRRHTLGRAIRSLVSQTYSDWEIVVVDDGSTDGTEELCQQYKKRSALDFDIICKKIKVLLPLAIRG